jgi:chemotaxis protein MotB
MRPDRRKSHVNHERWLVSYADFITLMFAFFVVLYASSQADKKKQAQVSQSINRAFKALGLFQPAFVVTPSQAMSITSDQDVSPVNIVLGEQLAASQEVKQDLTRVQRELQGKLSNQIARHVVAMHLGHDGLVISLREAGFYDSGSAIPHKNSMGSIDAIASSLLSVPYDIRIEGHTDDVPIHTSQFASNWELSTARATQMAKIFIDRYHFLPGRLSASGYAEYHPVASNETTEGRGQNRRVDIILLSRVSIPVEDAQAADHPPSEAASQPAARK